MAKLKRALGLLELVLAGIGIILGAGIYVIIGPAAAMAGNALWLSFGIAAVVALFTAASYAELSSRFPKAGAEYVYTEKAFNKRLAFLVGWLMIIGCIIAASAVALGFGGYFGAFFHTETVPIAFILLLLLSLLLIYGVKESALVGIVCSLIEVAGLLIIIFIAVPHFGSVNYLEFPSMTGVMSAAALVFFAFLGFEDMANMAEEVKNPAKTMPKGILIAVLVATVLYMLVAISAVSVLGWVRLGASGAPLADVASTSFLGQNSSVLIGIIALFATTNTVLFVLMGVSRLAYGMARSGMLPKPIGEVHTKRKTPWVAIIAATIASLIFALIGNIRTVASLTDGCILLVFLAINLSAAVIRYKEEKSGRKEKGVFRTPVTIFGVPLLPSLGVISCLILLFQIEIRLITLCLLLLIPGLVLYEMLERRKKKARN